MRPPKVTLPPPRRPVTSSMRMPLASNETAPLIDSSECGSEKCRSRPSCSVALPENSGFGQRSRHLRLERGGPAAAQVPEKSLEDPEVRVARCLDVDRLVLGAETAVELQLRSLAGEPEPADLEHVLIERQLDRSVVVDPVVEELEIELLDPRLDDELIGVGELADDAHGAADDRRRVR